MVFRVHLIFLNSEKWTEASVLQIPKHGTGDAYASPVFFCGARV